MYTDIYTDIPRLRLILIQWVNKLLTFRELVHLLLCIFPIGCKGPRRFAFLKNVTVLNTRRKHFSLLIISNFEISQNRMLDLCLQSLFTGGTCHLRIQMSVCDFQSQSQGPNAPLEVSFLFVMKFITCLQQRSFHKWGLGEKSTFYFLYPSLN